MDNRDLLIDEQIKEMDGDILSNTIDAYEGLLEYIDAPKNALLEDYLTDYQKKGKEEMDRQEAEIEERHNNREDDDDIDDNERPDTYLCYDEFLIINIAKISLKYCLNQPSARVNACIRTYNLAVDRDWVERKLNKFRTALLQIRPNTGAAAGGSKKKSFKNKKTKYHKKTKHHKKTKYHKKTKHHKKTKYSRKTNRR